VGRGRVAGGILRKPRLRPFAGDPRAFVRVEATQLYLATLMVIHFMRRSCFSKCETRCSYCVPAASGTHNFIEQSSEAGVANELDCDGSDLPVNEQIGGSREHAYVPSATWRICASIAVRAARDRCAFVARRRAMVSDLPQHMEGCASGLLGGGLHQLTNDSAIYLYSRFPRSSRKRSWACLVRRARHHRER